MTKFKQSKLIATTSVAVAVLFLAQTALAQRGGTGPVQVIAAPVVQSQLIQEIEALGTLKANESIVLTADVSEKVAALHFTDGQQVNAGDLLVTLDIGEEQAELAAAQAQLAEVTAAYNRAQELKKSSALSAATVQEREAELRSAEAAVAAAQARINRRAIRAPFNGVLGLRDVSLGSLVQPGQRMTTLDDLRTMKVDFELPEVHLGAVAPGTAISGSVAAFPGKIFTGSVQTVDTQIDPVTRTVRVRALLPNPDLTLRPGLLMTLTLAAQPRDSLTVPEEAVQLNGRQAFVYVVQENAEQNGMIAERRTITPGARGVGTVEVLAGLQAGEQVITHGLVKVRPGGAIKVRATETGDEPLPELLQQQQGE